MTRHAQSRTAPFSDYQAVVLDYEGFEFAPPVKQGFVDYVKNGGGLVSMNSVDYIVLLQRGTEWAATGAATIPVQRDFPTADKTPVRGADSCVFAEL